MKKLLLTIVLFISVSSLVNSAEMLVEAESFANKGGWVVDQQFMDLMGSPYLMAHGMGKPVDNATTLVRFPESGAYHVFVRTFNWVSPWYAGEGPGRFTLKVDDRKLPVVLGVKGTAWFWQYAGKVTVRDTKCILGLNDLTGFNGRCDAIYFTTDPHGIPPEDVSKLADFRKILLQIPSVPSETVNYDFVVAGGGIAGMCAAVAASRLGAKVALINDRPVLGGNNSSEIRVHLGGSIEMGPNKGLGRMIREFGHSREGNARSADYYEDQKKNDFISEEKNITLYSSFRAVSVRKHENRIESIIIKHVENGKEIRLVAPLFSDCTGDGTVGYLAGADFAIGREARAEFGEQMAPEQSDKMTMGASVQWYSVDKQSKTNFPVFKYGLNFNAQNCEKVSMGEWKWETGMNRDQIYDAERIRDYGLLVIYSNWSFLKNEYREKQNYLNKELAWVAYIAGKRESRRLLGDYILKQDDIDKNVFHEDASFTSSWSIDLHFPDSVNSSHFPGNEFKAATHHVRIYPYAVPYRCLFSRNIDNLFMAGRDISVTHVALGTVRVMRTTGMMGEVVGMAAGLCKKYTATPRKIYQAHLTELKELMKKGIGKENVPDSQKFNEQKPLKTPRAFGINQQ